jgi:DMSO/TMAO reductase YedYZ molybdopterin-dependent catalytic subunit
MREQRKVVTESPPNSETPLAGVRSWVTPNRLFFVRTHFETPAINLGTWRLRVEGLVNRPTEWTWDELSTLPERSVFATVESAGNGRSFLRPRVHGVPWGAGAVGHAEWTGVPLRLILERAGVRPGAVEMAFEGTDCGSEADHVLLARAVSASGQTQPTKHDLLHEGYLIHHSRPTAVEVVRSRQSQERPADADTLYYDMNAYAEENTRFPLDVEMEFAGGEGI